MPMRVQVQAFPMPGRREVALAIAAELEQPSPPTRETQTVELQVTAFDVNGKSRGSKRQIATLVLRPSDGPARYQVLTRLDLREGRYSLRFAGHSAALDLSGSVFQDIELERLDDDHVTLSDVVLTTQPEPVSAPRDALADVLPVVPTIERAFGQYESVTAFARLVLGKDRDPLPQDVVTTIVDVADRVVFEDRRQVTGAELAEARTADIEVKMPLPILEPGAYLLTMRLDDAQERRSVVRRLRFSVR